MQINSFKGTILAKRLTIIVAMTIAGTMLSPILVKLQGEYLTAVIVSVFATAKLAGGLLQPLMLKLSVYKIFWLLFAETLLSIITIMIYVLGFIPEQIFVVAMLILGVLDGIFGCAYLMIIKNGIAALFIEVYAEFQSTVKFLESLASLLAGGTLTLLLMLFDIKVGLTLGACFLSVAIIIDCLTVKNVWWMDKRKDIIILRKKGIHRKRR